MIVSRTKRHPKAKATAQNAKACQRRNVVMYELEGIESKRRTAPYLSGRRPEWVKIKCAEWCDAQPISGGGCLRKPEGVMNARGPRLSAR
jgi:ATP-dependent DNA ligase